MTGTAPEPTSPLSGASRQLALITRRRALAGLGGGLVSAGLAACRPVASAASGPPSPASPSARGSSRPAARPAAAGGPESSLHIPPLLAAQADASGGKVFELTAQAGTSSFLPGTTTPTWGFNGAYLGPTLRLARGDRVQFRFRNELPAATTLHSHGMHLPAVDDGGPHQLVPAGGSWSPSWTVDQPAATLWYHPHPDGQTADQVYRGLAGLYILDDPESQALPLPGRYGVNDIPVIIQDKNFLPDGSLDLTDNSPAFDRGRLGRTILVNGTYRPALTVGDQRVRLRLVNASDSRIYNIGFTDRRSFALIATDGGLVGRPVPLQRIQLAPAERAEIVVEFSPGEQATLHSFAPNLDLSAVPGGGFYQRDLNGGGEAFDLLKITAASSLRPAPALPASLVALPAPDPARSVRTRTFQLDGSVAINGMRMDPNKVNAVVLANTEEIWEISGFLPHDFHIHGVSFRVLDDGRGAPPPQQAGLKDTVYVPPFQTVRLLVPFGHYTDPHHPYMYHCHIMQHEDAGMMGQFVVIRPDQRGQVSVGGRYDGMSGMAGMSM